MPKSTRGDAFWLQIYNGVGFLLSPFILVKKALKFRRFGHAYEWDKARWSIPTHALKAKGRGARIALVGLGWAEVVIIDKVSRRLEADTPGLDIVWVLRDVEAREMAQKAFPSRAIVPMPFDFAVPQRNFLKHVNPDILVIVEKFWWPNLVWGAKLAGAQVVLVNGRSRGRDKARYKIMSGFQRWVVRAFDLLLFESESQIKRVRDVLPRDANASATGNLKWSFETPQPPPQSVELEAWLQERKTGANGVLPLLIAGSTSPIDEEWSLEAWQKVRIEAPCALLIVPRVPSRAAEVVAALEKQGFEVSTRSRPRSGCEILVMDTMGELSYAYHFCQAAYVGGSVEGRGHNILEPLICGIPVAYGPKRGDFEAVQITAEEEKVGVRLHQREELAQFWLGSFDATTQAELKRRATQLFEAQKRSFDATIEAIERILPPA